MTLQDLAIRANFRESEKARQKEKNKAHVSGGRFHETLQTFSKNHSFQPFKIWMGLGYLIMFHQGGHSNQWYCVLSCPKEHRFKGSSPSPSFSMNKTVPPVYICLSNMQPQLFLEPFPSIKWTGILSIQISRNQKMKLAKFKKKMMYIFPAKF